MIKKYGNQRDVILQNFNELSAIQRWNALQKYTQQKKKRTTMIFPLRSPYNTKMLIVMKDSFQNKFY